MTAGGLAFDPDEAVAHLRRTDDRLAGLIDAIGPFELELQGSTTTFAALAEAIVYQQLTGKAAATIFGRVRGLAPKGARALAPDHILAASEDELRAVGLSRQKALSLRDLAAKTLDGTVPTLRTARTMDDEELIAHLSAVRGIGRWTAEMFLIFRLGRPDVWPVDDYAIQKAFAASFNAGQMPTRKELAAYGERWRPYRTVVSWYLWRAGETVLLAPEAGGKR